METIEEAKNRLENTTEGKNGFYRGVLWAMIWRSVEDEPPPMNKSLLLRDEINSLYFGRNTENGLLATVPHNHKITHWRPIEIK